MDVAHTRAVVDLVLIERVRAHELHGDQSHLPDGTGEPGDGPMATRARWECQNAAASGRVTWRQILAEEVAEAFAESDPALLIEELVQVAGVTVAWVEALQDRSAGTEV